MLVLHIVFGGGRERIGEEWKEGERRTSVPSPLCARGGSGMLLLYFTRVDGSKSGIDPFRAVALADDELMGLLLPHSLYQLQHSYVKTAGYNKGYIGGFVPSSSCETANMAYRGRTFLTL